MKLVRELEMSALGAIGIVFLSSTYLMPFIDNMDREFSPEVNTASAASAFVTSPPVQVEYSITEADLAASAMPADPAAMATSSPDTSATEITVTPVSMPEPMTADAPPPAEEMSAEAAE